MLEKYVKFNTINDVKNFVEITATKDYNITLESDKYIVDAKSIVGILSLDLTKPLKMKADCKSSVELLRQIDGYLYNLLGNLK